jgi:hypothetical protein
MYSVQMAFLVGALLHVGLCPMKSSKGLFFFLELSPNSSQQSLFVSNQGISALISAVPLGQHSSKLFSSSCPIG